MDKTRESIVFDPPLGRVLHLYVFCAQSGGLLDFLERFWSSVERSGQLARFPFESWDLCLAFHLHSDLFGGCPATSPTS